MVICEDFAVRPQLQLSIQANRFITAQNVIGGSGLDILAPAPVGVSGPMARDVGNVYEATFVHRREIAREVNHFMGAFDKRTGKYQAQLTTASQNLKQANTVFESSMARSENIDKVSQSCLPAFSFV